MTLDELLLEWSYRSEKGYPCLDNPSDISLLKQILNELKLPTDKVLNKLKEAGKDNLEIGNTDGMENSPIEKEKEEEEEEKQNKQNTQDLSQAIDQELDSENLDACEVGKKEINRVYDKLAAKGIFSNPKAIEKFINRACSFESYEPIKNLIFD